MTVYVDHNVVIALEQQDQRPEENAAIRLLKRWLDSGRIMLAVSAVHDRETAPPEQYREAQARILASFPRVEFAHDHRFYAMNVDDQGRRGSMAYPLVEDDIIARLLREIGLDRLDAHHVMLAIKRECAAFVTCDEATILKYRAQVEAEFPIRLMLPSELVREIESGWRL